MRRTFSYYTHLLALAFVVALVLAGCGSQSSSNTTNGKVTVNLGYFPNLTHTVAIVGVARGTFQASSWL